MGTIGQNFSYRGYPFSFIQEQARIALGQKLTFLLAPIDVLRKALPVYIWV
jgi:hypothetical protein